MYSMICERQELSQLLLCDATGRADLMQQLLTLRHDCTVSLSVSEGGPGASARQHTQHFAGAAGATTLIWL